MKHILLTITLLVSVSLVACATAPAQASANEAATVATAFPTIAKPSPVRTTVVNSAEETEVRNLVENFGEKLKMISLLSPEAAQDLQKQYADFVSPTLLERWMNDVSKAPGRMVSSPWPDRIEITTLSKQDSDRYEATGFIIEITSTEIDTDKAAAKIPVHLAIQREQGRWLITEYAEEK